MPGAQQTIIINATPDKVFQVITDYGNYPTFLKEVSSCVVDSRDGSSVVATMTLMARMDRIMYITPTIEWSH